MSVLYCPGESFLNDEFVPFTFVAFDPEGGRRDPGLERALESGLLLTAVFPGGHGVLGYLYVTAIELLDDSFELTSILVSDARLEVWGPRLSFLELDPAEDCLCLEDLCELLKCLLGIVLSEHEVASFDHFGTSF